MGTVNLTWDVSSLKSKLESTPKLEPAIMALLKTESQNVKAYMQRNAPWTDRTGDARKFLDTAVESGGSGIYRIKLSHGVDYGIWLELCNEKRYAIIQPTIEQYGPTVIKNYNNFLVKVL